MLGGRLVVLYSEQGGELRWIEKSLIYNEV